MPAAATASSRRPPAARQRILIAREGETQWDLVGAGETWFVERVGPEGVEQFVYDVFEISDDGRRLANSLNVALARTPKG